MKPAELIPSVVPFDAEKTIRTLLVIHGFSDWVHIDIDDGKFTPRATLEIDQIPQSALHGLHTELHLMVQQPEPFVDQWIPRRPKRIILHAESRPSAFLIQRLQHEGIEVLIGICAGSPTSLFDPYLHLVDSFLFLCITPPGDQGRPFLPEVLPGIRAFHKEHPAATIECDGGITSATIQHVLDAGATRVVAGSAIFGSDRSPAESYTYLRQRMLDKRENK